MRPKKDSERIPTPSPEPSPRVKIRNLPVRTTRSSRKMKYPRRIPSDLSLTTISEEPSQYSSTEIVVQPEVVVETSVPKDGGGQQTTQKITEDSHSRHSSASRNVNTFCLSLFLDFQSFTDVNYYLFIGLRNEILSSLKDFNDAEYRLCRQPNCKWHLLYTFCVEHLLVHTLKSKTIVSATFNRWITLFLMHCSVRN